MVSPPFVVLRYCSPMKLIHPPQLSVFVNKKKDEDEAGSLYIIYQSIIHLCLLKRGSTDTRVDRKNHKTMKSLEMGPYFYGDLIPGRMEIQ